MRYTPKQLARALIETCEQKGVDIDKAADGVVALLAQQRELARVRDVMEAVEHVWKQKYGAATVTIQTAHPLTAALHRKIEEAAAGAEVRSSVNQQLIGGARVRVDDRIIDGSITGKLEQLKSVLNHV